MGFHELYVRFHTGMGFAQGFWVTGHVVQVQFLIGYPCGNHTPWPQCLWFWCCNLFGGCIGSGIVGGRLGNVNQKYHYYFLILDVQLLTYTVYFPVHPLLISHKFTAFHSHVNSYIHDHMITFELSSLIITAWAHIVVSCTQHNWGTLIWQSVTIHSNAKSIYSPLHRRIFMTPIVYII